MQYASIVLSSALLLTACTDDGKLSEKAALSLIKEVAGTGFPNDITLGMGVHARGTDENVYKQHPRGKILAELDKDGFIESSISDEIETSSGRLHVTWQIMPTKKLEPYIVKRKESGSQFRATVQLLSEPRDLKIASIKQEGPSDAIVEFTYSARVTDVGVAARRTNEFRWKEDEQTMKWRVKFGKLDGSWHREGKPRRIRL